MKLQGLKISRKELVEKRGREGGKEGEREREEKGSEREEKKGKERLGCV